MPATSGHDDGECDSITSERASRFIQALTFIPATGDRTLPVCCDSSRSSGVTMMTGFRFAAAVAGLSLLILPARGEGVLRIAMTASDVPTTTGMPNNGFDGLRFLGYMIFERSELSYLCRSDRLPGHRR